MLLTTVRIIALVKAVLLSKVIAVCVLLDTRIATVFKVNSNIYGIHIYRMHICRVRIYGRYVQTLSLLKEKICFRGLFIPFHKKEEIE